VAGLAGLRVGYGIAHPAVADQIHRVKSPYNVNAAGLFAAEASLQDLEYLMANVQRINIERERLTRALGQLGYLEPIPSCASSVLCRVSGRTGPEVRDALRARGIWIRAYGILRLRDYVRISVGTPEQDDRLLDALRAVS